ncbi:MAG: glutamate--tRNA ligase family protein [Vicinamibacteraceae bacterium]
MSLRELRAVPGSIVGRLAPTPSGRLHLGNVCAAGAAWLSVRQRGGRLLLRIEDVDAGRARRDIADDIRADLDWLGLTCDAETPPQSARDYTPALARLAPHTYRCGCTRAASREAGGACVAACRSRGLTDGAIRFALPAGVETIVDRALGQSTVDLATLPDPVLQRRDGCATYTLAVVADDIADGVTEVARGADLADQSAVQAVLWRALGAEPPAWLHAPLILGGDGKKLSKSHRAAAVGDLRALGWSAGDIWRTVLPWLGLAPFPAVHGGAAVADGPAMLHHALPAFEATRIPRGPFTWVL